LFLTQRFAHRAIRMKLRLRHPPYTIWAFAAEFTDTRTNCFEVVAILDVPFSGKPIRITRRIV